MKGTKLPFTYLLTYLLTYSGTKTWRLTLRTTLHSHSQSVFQNACKNIKIHTKAEVLAVFTSSKLLLTLHIILVMTYKKTQTHRKYNITSSKSTVCCFKFRRRMLKCLYANVGATQLTESHKNWHVIVAFFAIKLPSEWRCIAVDSTFRRRLKAELFSRAYGVSINI